MLKYKLQGFYSVTVTSEHGPLSLDYMAKLSNLPSDNSINHNSLSQSEYDKSVSWLLIPLQQAVGSTIVAHILKSTTTKNRRQQLPSVNKSIVPSFPYV